LVFQPYLGGLPLQFRGELFIDLVVPGDGNQFCFQALAEDSGRIIAIDARQVRDEWVVYVAGGTIPTEKELFGWAKEAQERGAGEILFTSMNHDGTKNGFALKALKKMGDELCIPVIASGGAGSIEHFYDVFHEAGADAGLAASIFHFQEIRIHELKESLRNSGIIIR